MAKESTCRVCGAPAHLGEPHANDEGRPCSDRTRVDRRALREVTTFKVGDELLHPLEGAFHRITEITPSEVTKGDGGRLLHFDGAFSLWCYRGQHYTLRLPDEEN